MEAVFRVIDHTADVAIEAEAADAAGLFDQCARGMFSLLVEGEPAAASSSAALATSAHDLPELLVAWLRELLWRHVDQGWLYAGADFGSLAPERLAATVRGETISPGRHTVVREIKAVTYHDLVAERRGDGWFARVVFDV
jgi:SHS2 domain-containing protein